MRVYRVGGSVRDTLLGLPVKDHDYVVVGASAAQLLAQGFIQVGADFPVFLHPHTRAEYALARTERKSAPGYKGFAVFASPEVSLEEDLSRRDLTINAMALDAEGQLIDPFGGAADLRAGVLRHVSAAFVEDPVRVLRIARFAARFQFRIAPETEILMRRMVDAGELDHLVAERVWQELVRGLRSKRPSLMFRVLRDCGALQRVVPELDRLAGMPLPPDRADTGDLFDYAMTLVDIAAAEAQPLSVRFSVLCLPLGHALSALVERLRVPGEYRAMAKLVAGNVDAVVQSHAFDAAAAVHLFDRCDAYRKPERFAQFLSACGVVLAAGGVGSRARSGRALRLEHQPELFLAALDAARSVKATPVIAGLSDPAAIHATLRAARIAAIESKFAADAGAVSPSTGGTQQR
jgi:tRNA nucleotidyltransferase (CCA-adding enzyme)